MRLRFTLVFAVLTAPNWAGRTTGQVVVTQMVFCPLFADTCEGIALNIPDQSVDPP